MGHNLLIVNEGKVYDPALIGIHGSKANLPPLPDRTRCRRACKRNKFLLTTHLVSLYVNHNGIVEVYRVAHIGVDEHLQSIECTTVTTDEHGKITTAHVEDQFPLVAIVLVYDKLFLTKKGK